MNRYALIAQPDPKAARMYASVVEALGLRALVVADGTQALEMLFERGAPALAVVELTMPVVDGFEVIERLRTMGSLDRTAVLATSPFRVLRGYAGYGASRLGIDKVLGRPSERSIFERTVMTLLGLRPEGPEPPRAPSRTRVRAVRPREPVAAPSDTRLQWFVDRVAREFDVEVAMARLELDDGRTLTATTGIDPRDVRRMDPFCHLVLEASQSLVVCDTLTNPFFKDEPVVRAGLVRGYAGAPIIDGAGDTRGMLSLVNARSPLSLEADGHAALIERAGQVGQVVSYLGGRAVPRHEGAREEPTSRRMSVEGSGQWSSALEEAPTEPGNATGS
jgi:CheY-like chemotaxis protein